MLIMTIVSCKKKSNDPEPAIIPTGPDIEVPPAAEANTLPVKVRIGTKIYTITYQSGSKKIDKITKSDGGVETYHYTGDLIDKIDYDAAGNDYTKFEYNEKGALIRETHYRSGNAAAKTEYTYPSADKVTFTESEYKNNNWKAGEPATLEFDGKGNVVKGGSKDIQVSVSYNDKNTPFLNVTGWSKIHFTGGIPLGDNVDVEDVVGRRNNPIKTKVTGAALLDLDFNYEFGDNNNAKFPTKITGKEGTETAFIVEVCYSENCNISDNPVDPNDPDDPNNEEQPNQETATLPQKIVMNSNGETRTYTITYQGNTARLDKITETNGLTMAYQYKGDLIEKEYNANKADEYNLYQYNGNNQLTKISGYRGSNKPAETEVVPSGTKAIATGEEIGEEGSKLELNYDSKGNLTNLKMFDNGKGDTPIAEVSITYDTKNAPFMNVLGWRQSRLLIGVPLGDNIGYEDIMAVVNNPLEVTGKVNDNIEVIYDYEFKDSKNPKFPTKITGRIVKEGKTAHTFDAEITYS